MSAKIGLRQVTSLNLYHSHQQASSNKGVLRGVTEDELFGRWRSLWLSCATLG
jgi:hypothetical protein